MCCASMTEHHGPSIYYAVHSLHQIGITHTDLKTENVLLKHDLKGEHVISDGGRAKWPVNPRVKVIDLGGAVWDTDGHTSIVNTRQYRAPEVMLQCCPWGHPSDVWGIGCIAIELYKGSLLFQTRKDELEHLAMIEKSCGNIPKWMAERANSLKHFFNTSESFLAKNKTYYRWPLNQTTGASLQKVCEHQTLDEIVDSQKHPLFLDLVKKLLTVDPDHRITCKKALQHPFFQ